MLSVSLISVVLLVSSLWALLITLIPGSVLEKTNLVNS